ncbi:YiiD C-terminal domain-containing protein [Anaerotignum lactatifermentans]|uniref:YiiD C-terminal domain-containing protein n=1 Tax=Anaerotignum lactatifermentans TaxID=160404 RepID=A0ABS2GB38_9FIRM|nr:YiiD C-terminal domain-containing protein [Anaerotignum lactatifermentans]MBM6830149.1 YiiD C-terminal domain-containing protein [Anaerotignum lactatifermentans]MBM6878706.1 YiiD C-terminal domain-containing protein [Anaerotignum lactatifermentans]MBM6951762.1 YiiD C-terminal domain-containing protein [Anaerotignum lactatifermentans]
MTPQEFTDFLYREIPLTKAMEIQTLSFTTEFISLAVPLEPNRNDKHTGFGGSISCLMTVCGWAMMYANFREEYPEGKIVVQSSQIRYLAPILSDFRAECRCTDEAAKDALRQSWQQRKKGRLRLEIVCFCGETEAARMAATYYITE